MHNKIGVVLRKVRKSRSMSMKQIVDKLEGYDQTSLSRFERGMQGATPDRIAAICDALDVSVGMVYNELDRMNGIELKPLSIKDLATDDDSPDAKDVTLSCVDFVTAPYLDFISLPAGENLSMDELKTTETAELPTAALTQAQVKLENVLCAKIRDDSLDPVIPAGAMVAINAGDIARGTGAFGLVHGKVYAVNHLGMVRFARVYGLPGGGYRLKFYNKEYPEEKHTEEDVVIIGRVFWYSSVI